MSWEWSHTDEAYENFADNVRDLDAETLRVIWAEWKAHRGNNLDELVYKLTLDYAAELTEDVLAEDIISQAEELRTCENGGHMAWACPFGCWPHLVSFDRVVDDEE